MSKCKKGWYIEIHGPGMLCFGCTHRNECFPGSKPNKEIKEFYPGRCLYNKKLVLKHREVSFTL